MKQIKHQAALIDLGSSENILGRDPVPVNDIRTLTDKNSGQETLTEESSGKSLGPK